MQNRLWRPGSTRTYVRAAICADGFIFNIPLDAMSESVSRYESAGRRYTVGISDVSGYGRGGDVLQPPAGIHGQEWTYFESEEVVFEDVGTCVWA